MTRTCADCAAFATTMPEQSECRRHSPSAALVPAPGGLAGSMAVLGIYPSTRRDSWCLEWSQRPAPVTVPE